MSYTEAFSRALVAEAAARRPHRRDHRRDALRHRSRPLRRDVPRALLRRRHRRGARGRHGRRSRARAACCRSSRSTRRSCSAPTTRLIMDVALQNLHVVFCLDRAGLVGEDGPTHHGVFDLTYLRSIPNMMVLAPADEAELAEALHTALAADGPGRDPLPARCGTRRRDAASRPRRGTPGRAQVRRTGTDVALLAVGRMVGIAEEAAEMLAAAGCLGERGQRALGQAARLRDGLVGGVEPPARRDHRGEHRDGRLRRGGVRGARRPGPAGADSAPRDARLLRAPTAR